MTNRSSTPWRGATPGPGWTRLRILVSPDQPWPDTMPPDHGPYWDQGGGTTCNTLLVSPAKPIQVSRTVSTHSGAAPSITAVGETFYVAFTENNEVLVREVHVTSTAATVPTFSAKLNLTGTAAAPWITYNKVGQKLAVVWHEKTTTGNCSSNIYFRELSPTASGFTLATPCHLNPSYTTYGYGPASLVHNGTTYLLVAPVEYAGQACGTHTKIKFHPFTGCTPFSGAYNSVSSLLNTFLPVVAASGKTTNPYVMIRLQDPGTSGNPTTLNIRPHVGTSATNFPLLTSFGAEQGELNRPSVAVSGNSTWYAWTDTMHQIKLLHRDGSTTLTPNFPLSGYAKNPFLAYKPQVGSSGVNAKTVLAFTQTTSSGSSSTAVKLAVLQNVPPAVQTTHTVVSASSTGFAGWQPKQTVVAAGTNGFGVAWTEQVSSAQTEVFFQWVGCQP